MSVSYVGRFAPSPTGVLHAGSLVAALASWLDARAHAGRWHIRIDDLDSPRNAPGAAEGILAQLDRCGLRADGPVVFQSQRTAGYEHALRTLIDHDRAYPCGCSRRDLALAVAPDSERERHAELVYPGTCRDGLQGKAARSWRLRLQVRSDGPEDSPVVVDWIDRRLGPQQENVGRAVGDFVLKRADGIWAYQLAVVVDDAAAGISDVVRGEDLADNTARQIVLQRALGLATPRYLHTPLVLDRQGEKLSKQTGALPLQLEDPLLALRSAGSVLGIVAEGTSLADWLAAAVTAWRAQWAD